MTFWPPLSSWVPKLPKIHFEIAIYEPNELMNLADKFGLPLTHYLLFCSSVGCVWMVGYNSRDSLNISVWCTIGDETCCLRLDGTYEFPLYC